MSHESDTPRTDAAELNFGEMPGLMRTLERKLTAAQALIAELELREKAIVQFCETTMNWMYFTVEMGLSKTPTVTEENANKMRDFLKRHGGLPTQPPAPHYLELPDANGPWWMWHTDGSRWVPMNVQPNFPWKSGIWVRATPPQWAPPNKPQT